MFSEYIESLKALQKDNWDAMADWQEKQKALQKIVDCYAKFLGIESLGSVFVIPFDKDDDAVAKYYGDSRQIVIREDLVVKGKMLMRGKPRDVAHPANYVFFYLMHEVKHAIQQYELEHPEASKDLEKLKLVKCNQHHTDDEKNTYFSRLKDPDDAMYMYAHCLYTLQPTERFAWEFAYEQLEIFMTEMHKAYPDDPAFVNKTTYSSFPADLRWANENMGAFDILSDIDDIVLTMNGEYVEKRLNGFICGLVNMIYSAKICEKIEYYQNRNEMIKEMEIQEEQRRQNECIKRDVSGLFDDVMEAATVDIEIDVNELDYLSAEDIKCGCDQNFMEISNEHNDRDDHGDYEIDISGP